MKARIGVAAAAAGLLLTGCGGGGDEAKDVSASESSEQSSESAEPETFDVIGYITLKGEGGLNDGTGCRGSDGYDDMRVGAAVTVYDADGTAIALGALEQGLTVNYNANRWSSDCEFKFVVEDVPRQDGSNIYSVEVSHRGQIQFTEDDASSLAFSLG